MLPFKDHGPGGTRDFSRVCPENRDAADADVHPGLIILRASGLNRAEQRDYLEPVIEHLESW